jgi:hypothetical protein
MRNYKILIALIIGFLVSCQLSTKQEIATEIKLYNLRYQDIENSIDTIYIERDTSLLITIDSLCFIYKNKKIKIEKKALNHKIVSPPGDGDYIAFWEKNVGIFYSRPMCLAIPSRSGAFEILETNNDSINSYISFLLGVTLTCPRFCIDPFNEIIIKNQE